VKDGKRMLNFSPTDTAFGKNPAQLPPLEVPHYSTEPLFLAGVLAKIKSELNRQSAEQIEVAAILADWSAKFDEAATAEDYNALMPQTEKADPRVVSNVKRLLVSKAKAKGIEFDGKAKAFAMKAAA
jgi:hypothetical protein